ncbi:hypothetical protein AB1Y20_004048 [Prymnesium parvum]|uniref:Uncharacterized protein n=1 Tax=Prymnesium parvum TaxID=97485 RepID=A0AB34J6B8_PRYPA
MEAAEALAKLKAENDELEKMIATLSSGQTKLAGTKHTFSEAHEGIKVMNFGQSQVANEAGKDLGSSWCPPQCSRRTVLGGFFTS